MGKEGRRVELDQFPCGKGKGRAIHFPHRKKGFSKRDACYIRSIGGGEGRTPDRVGGGKRTGD